MDLTKDDVLKIIKLIDESGYADVRLEVGDFKLHVQRTGGSQLPAPPSAEPKAAIPTAAVAATQAPPASQEVIIPEGLIAIRSPMLGTFYRASGPGEKPFVEVGQQVAPEDTVCLVEVMKLFNSVKAEVAGRVAKIVVENAELVEHDQVLILIEPTR